MSKEVDFKNRDRFIQLGIAIAALRKMRGMSQEKLAEKIDKTTNFIGAAEAPNVNRTVSLDTLFDIAKALDVPPYKFFSED